MRLSCERFSFVTGLCVALVVLSSVVMPAQAEEDPWASVEVFGETTAPADDAEVEAADAPEESDGVGSASAEEASGPLVVGQDPAAEEEAPPRDDQTGMGEQVADEANATDEDVADDAADKELAAEEDATQPIEQMVVLGIQRSLEGALAAKRRTTNLTESIYAEEIGQLPDENVAEVLENIPGVQITREGGIGEAVSVRGSEDNRVELNGRGTLSDQDNRGGIRFSDLPAALVKTLTVTKVPTADMVEGSIGGTINVKTYRGLKLNDPLAVGRFTAEYADNSESWNENYSATLGNRFETPIGDVGAIFTFSRIDKRIREDSLRVTPIVRELPQNGVPNFPNFDAIPNTGVVNGGEDLDRYYYPGLSDTVYGEQERSNTSVTGSLEWQATSSSKIFFEGTYNRIDNLSRSQSAFAAYGPGGLGASDRELDGLPNATFEITEIAGLPVPVLTSGIIGGGVVNQAIDGSPAPGAPNDGLQIRTSNRTSQRITDSYSVATGGEWFDENWLVEIEVNAAQSQSDTNAFVSVWQYNDPAAANFHTGAARVRIPFAYNGRAGNLAYGPRPGASQANNLLNPSFYSLFIGRNTETRFNNDLFAQKIDVDRSLYIPFFEEIGFGARFSQRSTERQRDSVSTGSFPGVAATDIGGLLVRTPGDFFDFNSDEPYLRNFLTIDADKAGEFRRYLVQNANLAASSQLAPPQGFLVDENTYAAYVRLDFETDALPWAVKGNVGVRFVHTDQTAKGSQLFRDLTFAPTSVRQAYENWLPSASVVISPIEDVQVRIGYARILRRPSFAQLAPTFEYPLNAGQAVVIGDPTLRPTTADQVDVALEWYFYQGSVLSIGYFYKDLDSVIGQRLRRNAICNPLADIAATANCAGGTGVFVNEVTWVNQPGGRIQGRRDRASAQLQVSAGAVSRSGIRRELRLSRWRSGRDVPVTPLFEERGLSESPPSTQFPPTL